MVSNSRQFDCLFSCANESKLHIAALCEENLLSANGFPPQRVSTEKKAFPCDDTIKCWKADEIPTDLVEIENSENDAGAFLTTEGSYTKHWIHGMNM